jgi:hypothetical protein
MDRELEAVLKGIQAQLAALTERVARLEDVGQVSRSVQPAAARTAPAPKAVIPEEHLLAIAGALAAYFGVCVHVRQIRLVSSPAWSQQGRVWVQASHSLER